MQLKARLAGAVGPMMRRISPARNARETWFSAVKRRRTRIVSGSVIQNGGPDRREPRRPGRGPSNPSWGEIVTPSKAAGGAGRHLVSRDDVEEAMLAGFPFYLSFVAR